MTYNRKGNLKKTIFDRRRTHVTTIQEAGQSQKPEDTTDSRPSRGEKSNKGLSVFSNGCSYDASLLGIIVTSFTIMGP